MVCLRYVKSVPGAQKYIDHILTNERPIVGVKCLGVNLGPKGTVTLICISTYRGDAYVFDVKKCPDIIFDGGIQRLLQATNLLKVFHDIGADQAVLTKQYNITVRNYFDTQVAYSVVMEGWNLPPRRIALEHICEKYQLAVYCPPPDLQRLIAEDPNIWARRPCSKEMINTAAAFVFPLVPSLHEHLSSALPPEKLDWYNYLCEENKSSHLKPEKTTRIRNERRAKQFRKNLYELPVTSLSEHQERLLAKTIPETRSWTNSYVF